ncbi:MAG: YfcC family protein, partial [Acetoanaerobium sp.]|nr:YfcC family protein [Acetoanaerobium sp.]
MSSTGTKKKLSFPTAYTVLFIVLILAAALTHVVPAGKYSTLLFDESVQAFVVTSPDGETQELEATQSTLDQLGVQVDVEKFTDGSIYKPVAIPNTYQELESNPQGIMELIKAPIEGVYETI